MAACLSFGFTNFIVLVKFQLLNMSFRKFSILLTTDLRLLAYFVIFMQKTKFFLNLFFKKLIWNASESSDPSVKFCPFTLLANVPLQYFSLLISYVNEFTESSR